MKILPIATLCAFALCAGAADPSRFTLARSDSPGEDDLDGGLGIFSLDDSAIRLACTEEAPDAAGAQPPVAILCHGFAARKESPLFDALSEALRARGVAVARFDFNGHGESDGEFRDMTVSNEVLDAKTVVDFYRDVRNARVALVGHSQGAVVAALAASELGAENVETLALLAPAAVLREDALRGRIFDAVFDPLDPPETVPVADGSLELGRDYILGAQQTDPYSAVAAYAGPLLVVHGRGDTVVPWTYGERFVSGRLGGRFTLLPKADHAFSGVEKAVAEEVAQFVAACFNAGAAEEETHAESAESAEVPAPAAEEIHAESAEVAEAPAPAEEETHAESAEVAEVPAPAAEEEHAESAEVAEASAPAEEETHAESAEVAEVPAPAAEETHAEAAESAEVPAPAAESAEVAEAPAPAAEETHAEAAEIAEAPAPVDAGGEAAPIQSTAAAEPPAVDSPTVPESVTVASLAAAHPAPPVKPGESVVDILVAPNGFAWQGLEVTEDDLLDRIRLFGESDSSQPVRIDTFPDMPVETLRKIFDALQSAGFSSVSIRLPPPLNAPAP